MYVIAYSILYKQKIRTMQNDNVNNIEEEYSLKEKVNKNIYELKNICMTIQLFMSIESELTLQTGFYYCLYSIT